MIAYYCKLAFKSLLRTPLVSAISVIAIGLGIAVPTTMISIRHVFAQDPIPEKSDVLFNVRMDSWDPDGEFFDIEPGDPPKHVTYRDMAGLLDSELAEYRTGIATAVIYVFPEKEGLEPFQASVRLCHADFFAMFDAPFAHGTGWTRAVDREPEPVTVLSHEANDELFGGEDSVGRRVRLGETEFTVIGVLAPWRPTPQYYDVINNALGRPRQFFMPFDLIRDQAIGLSRRGDADSWGPSLPPNDPNAFFDIGETTWIQYWVQLSAENVQAYGDHVDAYTLSQKELGRFPRPLNNRVTPLMEWMEVRGVVPPVASAMVVISLLFLAACALNLTGLLLGKFLAASAHVGVHRALGASRATIFVQRLLECEIVGLLGGLLGVGIASLGLRTVSGWMSTFSQVEFSMDGGMLAVAAGLSLVAGLISGMYPAWRACRIAPAIQLKL